MDANRIEDMLERLRRRENQRMLLRLDQGVWVIEHYVDGTPDPFVICVFGTHIIVAPFTEHADYHLLEEYRRHLARTHPRHEIVIAEEHWQ